MKRISEQEFEKLPKKAPTVDLKPGKLYYIRDTKASPLVLEDDVYIGKFLEKDGDYFKFEDIDVLVTRRRNTIGKPFSFKNIERYKFMEVIDDKPTSKDIQRKKENIEEIIEYIRLKRAEPHETPTVSFFGKDYRKAKERFEKLQEQHENKSKSPKTQSKGGRMSRRKANKNYTRKQRKQRKQRK